MDDSDKMVVGIGCAIIAASLASLGMAMGWIAVVPFVLLFGTFAIILTKRGE